MKSIDLTKGLRQPIVIDSNNVVVCGHGRLEAAKRLGYITVPCECIDDMTEDEIKMYRILDNRSASIEYDLEIEMGELMDIEFDVSEYDMDISQLEYDIAEQQEKHQQYKEDTQQAPAMSAQYDAFMKMSDDQKAAAIVQAISQDIPDHLNKGSDFQRLIYNLGMNDKPQVVDDATLNKMNGTEIFRTVNAVYDRATDLSFTAPQIAKQTQAGKITRVSSDSSAVYGDGIYFADSRSGSAVYGRTRGNVQKTCMMRAKLNSNAKAIGYYTAAQGVSQEINSGSKLGQALKKCNYSSRASVYALAKGYNVIDAGNGYYSVLNRNAVTMSQNVNAI